MSGPRPVEFDDQALGAPERIDDEGTDPDVGLGEGDAMPFAEKEETVLERAQRARQLGHVPFDRPPQPSATGMAAAHHPARSSASRRL